MLIRNLCNKKSWAVLVPIWTGHRPDDAKIDTAIGVTPEHSRSQVHRRFRLDGGLIVIRCILMPQWIAMADLDQWKCRIWTVWDASLYGNYMSSRDIRARPWIGESIPFSHKKNLLVLRKHPMPQKALILADDVWSWINNNFKHKILILVLLLISTTTTSELYALFSVSLFAQLCLCFYPSLLGAFKESFFI